MWVELGCEKNRSGLEDLIRPAQLTHLTAQAAQLFSILAAQQLIALAKIGFAWRTHLRSVSAGMPKSRATWTIGRPESKTNRAPRSNNSSGYFLGRDIAQEILHSPGQDPGFGVSVETGLAQIGIRVENRRLALDWLTVARW